MMVPKRSRWIKDLDQGKQASAGRMQLYRPNEECPWGRCDIRLFAVGVHPLRNGGYVQTKVEEINDYVQDLGNSLVVSTNYRKRGGNDLEQDAVSPRVSHDGLIDELEWRNAGQARPL